MTRSKLRRGALALALTGALAFSLPSSSQAYEWYPGLPDATFGQWTNASGGGLSYAKRAKQWFRAPAAMSVAEVQIAGGVVGNNPVSFGFVRSEAYFISPDGAPGQFGYLEPMTVRSVGFGLMPVEAVVQVSQRRAGGLPIPFKVNIETKRVREFDPNGGPVLQMDLYFKGTTITDSLNVRILSVKVDGVDMKLNGNCRTESPAPFTLSSPDYEVIDVQESGPGSVDDWYRKATPGSYWHPQRGGQLSGSITIPPFTGCTTTSGDDLSDLLTLSASGPDNAMFARNGWPCPYAVRGAPAPLPPGASNPQAGTAVGGGAGGGGNPNPHGERCPGVKEFEYPDQPANGTPPR